MKRVSTNSVSSAKGQPITLHPVDMRGSNTCYLVVDSHVFNVVPGSGLPDGDSNSATASHTHQPIQPCPPTSASRKRQRRSSPVEPPSAEEDYLLEDEPSVIRGCEPQQQQQQQQQPDQQTTAAAEPDVRRRRMSHSQVERRRREKISKLILDLAELLPGPAELNPNPNKAVILERTTAFVQNLLDANQALAESNNSHKKQLDKLRQEHEAMKSERLCTRCQMNVLPAKPVSSRREERLNGDKLHDEDNNAYH